MKYLSLITSNFTLNDGSSNGLEVTLSHGMIADLPENNAHIKSLVAQGFLQPVPETPVSAPATTRRGRAPKNANQ